MYLQVIKIQRNSEPRIVLNLICFKDHPQSNYNRWVQSSDYMKSLIFLTIPLNIKKSIVFHQISNVD